ncbi:MAG: hypothetical protein KA116_01655 [Proteobacteria bacterium]|nr:hypothetical protein [Pseudomonadota bacterium]
MTPPTPNIEQYEKLAPIAERLYQHTDHIAHLALLPLFLLSVLFAYTEDLGIQGAVVTRVKKLILTALLLVAFPGLSTFIRDLGQEIALSIDNLQGIDEFLKAASQKADSYSANVTSLLQFGNDLMLSFFVSASFLILYFARFLLVAFYHFYWMILLVTGPFLILGNLFESTANLPKNLFKNLCLVACWPIIWSILSAFLKGLPFADAYSVEGGYTTIIVMNLILAVSLLFSPFLLSQFCEGLIVGAGSGVYSASKSALTMMMPKVGAVMSMASQKLYPSIRPYIPSKQSIFRNSSKLGIKMLVFCFFYFLSNKAEAQNINVRPGLSAVLCFEYAPDYIAVGESKYFQAQKLGKNLLIRTSRANEETNLLVFSKGSLFSSYKLSSNIILPHTESVNCKKQTTVTSTAPRAIIKSSKGNSSELIAYHWSSSKHDYLTLKVKLTNYTSKDWSPSWNKVQLKSNSGTFKHSSLKSERKSIVPNASNIFVVEFTRPAVGLWATLEIPSNNGNISLKLGALK